MVREQRVPTISGVALDAPVQTLCLHGDDPRAAGRARAIAAALARARIRVAPLGSWI
jgi:lactam utilization protein B